MTQRAASVFCCPHCHGALFPDEKSLLCEKNHRFDIARQGYVNLLSRQTNGLYDDAELFEARRAVYEVGFFDPVVDALKTEINHSKTLLDAGCGEGSLLYLLLSPGQVGIGVDIAKPAIKMAAGRYKGIHFCVGDLCNLPLPDHSIDCLLNVLTPANYAEFARVLAPGGCVIKVVPGPDHLGEIRALAGKTAPTDAEPGDRGAEAIFCSKFELVKRQKVRYTVSCDMTLTKNVYKMTPLTERSELLAPEAGPMSVTVDVTILSGGLP